MTAAEIFKEFRFEASHFLPNVPTGHKCSRMHGHSYIVELHVRGPIGETSGWVIDFADITAAWAPPYGYAVGWHGLAPNGACVVRTHPAPETVLGCDGQTTYFLYVEDGAMGGMVFELRDGSTVLATATLGGRVALPDVVGPE